MPGTFDQELQRLLNYLQSTQMDQDADFQGDNVLEMLEDSYPDELEGLYEGLEGYREEMDEERRVNAIENGGADTDADDLGPFARYRQLPDELQRIRFRQALVCFYRRHDPAVLSQEDELDSRVADFYLQINKCNAMMVVTYGARLEHALLDPRISINEEPPRHPLQPPS